jgi:hypothetical protein
MRRLLMAVAAAVLVMASAGSAMAQSYSFTAKIRTPGEYEFSPAVVVPNPSGLSEVIVSGSLNTGDRRDPGVELEGGLMMLLAPGEENFWTPEDLIQTDGNWYGRIMWFTFRGDDTTPPQPFARGGQNFCNQIGGKTLRGYLKAVTAAGNYGWTATWQ